MGAVDNTERRHVHEEEVCNVQHVMFAVALGQPRRNLDRRGCPCCPRQYVICGGHVIANSLKTEIEDYAAQLLRSSRLFRLAQEGAVTPGTVSAYLFNLRYLFRNNVAHLKLASKESEARGWSALANYYDTKATEEHGHDAWADNDLATVTRKHDVMLPSQPSPALAELIEYLRDVIRTAPQRYVAYILLVEYTTVLAGPAWLKALDERCGFPPSSLTAVGNHVELDREHVSEGLAEINELIAPGELPGLTETLLSSMRYLERFCDEISAADH
jgi:hypothetical protein